MLPPPLDGPDAAPTIAVVIPAYRSEATIGRAIESVLAQTLPANEIVVVDDGSDDLTAELAERYGGTVRVVRQPNGGTAAARNRGIGEARCGVVCFLDADDTYAPDRLAGIAAKFVAEPRLDGVLTDALLRWPGRDQLASSWWPAEASRERLDLRAKVIFCALAIRREVLAEVGPFDSAFHRLEDVEFWHRLICRGYWIGYVDDPSYIYCINPDGKTQTAPLTRGEHELSRVYRRYALARRTPNGWRLRLAVRALRHERRALRAVLVRR